MGKVFTLKQIGKKARGKRQRVYVGFIDLEKEYNRIRSVIAITENG